MTVDGPDHAATLAGERAKMLGPLDLMLGRIGAIMGREVVPAAQLAALGQATAALVTARLAVLELPAGGS